MKRCLAVLLSALVLLTVTPWVSADDYNDDQFDWGEYACPHTNVEEFVEIPSTCVTNGCGAYTRCADCKALLSGSRDPLPLGDHAYDNACDRDCNVCGAVREVAHIYESVITAPDCVNDGYTTYTCACGDSYVADHTGALGHTYDDAFDAACNDCGQIRPVPIPGDVNGDGKVNNRDLGLFQRYLSGFSVTVDVVAMDLNCDGKLNNRDLGLLQIILND